MTSEDHAAAVVADHRALRRAGWIVAALYSWWFLQVLTTRLLWLSFAEGGASASVETLFDVLTWLGVLTPLLLGLLSRALWRAGRSATRGMMRPAHLTAAVTFALLALVYAAWFAAIAARSDVIGGRAAEAALVGLRLLATAAFALALLSHGRRTRRAGQVKLAAAAFAVSVFESGLDALMVFAPDALGARGPLAAVDLLQLSLTAAAGVLLAVTTLGAAAYERARAEGAAPAGSAPPEEAAAWRPALAGLRLYRGALLVKIVVLVVALGVVIAGTAASSRPAVEGAMLFGALAGALTSFAMFVGLIRFGGLPYQTGAAEPVVAALLLLALALLAEAWGLVETVRLLSATAWDARAIVERLRVIDLAGQVVGLVAILTLLVALRRAALWLEADAAARRARTVRLLVLAVAPFAVLLRLETVLRALRGPALLAVALLALTLAVVMVALYLGLLGRLAAAIDARLRPPTAHRPPAPGGLS